MKLSTKGRYGLQAMEVLRDCYGQGPIPLNRIATEKGISEAYLEQLFSLLKKQGLVKSVRGAQGGYELERHPNDINIGEILRALEGDTMLSCCDDTGEPSCNESSPCRMKYLLDKIQDSYDEITISLKLSEM